MRHCPYCAFRVPAEASGLIECAGCGFPVSLGSVREVAAMVVAKRKGAVRARGGTEVQFFPLAAAARGGVTISRI